MHTSLLVYYPGPLSQEKDEWIRDLIRLPWNGQGTCLYTNERDISFDVEDSHSRKQAEQDATNLMENGIIERFSFITVGT